MKQFDRKIQWLLQEKYGRELTVAAKKDIAKIKKGEPLDYIIGWMTFLDCKIDLSRRRLIPRVETEYWTDQAIQEIKNDHHLGKSIRVLDLFAGSGAIGLAIAKHCKKARVVFADIDPECLKQIAINVKLSRLPKTRYQMVKSDVFKNITGTFDYIVANPPYIPRKRKNKVQPSVLEYEPEVALFGGEDGLKYSTQLLGQVRNFLKPEGRVYMEFDSMQKKSLERLVKKLGFSEYQFRRDQYGKWRYLMIIYKV